MSVLRAWTASGTTTQCSAEPPSMTLTASAGTAPSGTSMNGDEVATASTRTTVARSG